jgi:hypothetical protein
MRIKVVPRETPNAKGQWIEVETRPATEDGPSQFADMVRLYQDVIPKAHFAVQFETTVGV